MKKAKIKKTSRPPKPQVQTRERSIDTQPLPDELEAEASISSYWSDSSDRGDDLAEIKDPYMHGPEMDTRSYRRRRRVPRGDENLADLFDAERESQPPF